MPEKDIAKEKKKFEYQSNEKLTSIYGTGEEGEAEYNYAQSLISQINQDLELREKSSIISNGISYSQAYEYNQKKAINYSPPKSLKDDRQVSSGLVHEKIISFCAIFLKYVFKRRIKCYDADSGKMVPGMGEVYDLAIEFSHKVEEFSKKVALIYWETFTQGNCFVLEDFEVKIVPMPKAYMHDGKKRKPVTDETMDYTYEFLDGLEYEKGEEVQFRRAVSIPLDGRNVIFGNPEIEDIQKQPRITLEEVNTKADAEQLFSTLKRWDKIPKEEQEITNIIGSKLTLFDASRHKDPEDKFIIHRVFDKENNRFNIFVNGVMMLPRKTPMTLFYPRGNYPISNVPAERLRGSIYSRSIPAKTKFNADFIDWALKMLALKFEQGVNPAILSNSRYTLTRDLFRAGNVTQGVTRKDFEKADPDNNGVTNQDIGFYEMIKDIMERQTTNPTTSGELSSNTTAYEIATVEDNQKEKLGFLLDGLIGGFMDMALRRAETIESKYTIKQKEAMVDGKKVNVYQNFTINVSGVDNVVSFDDEVGSETYDEQGRRDELFEKSYKSKKDGNPTEYHLVNPDKLRKKKYIIQIDILPERIKDTQLQMIQLFDEFNQLVALFGRSEQGGSVNVDVLKKEYLKVSGRPDELFTSKLYKQLEQEQAAAQGGQPYNEGSFGKPTIKSAAKQSVVGR